MKKLYFYFLFILCLFQLQVAKSQDPRNQVFDVLHYRFELKLQDNNNRIEGKANVKIVFQKEVENFYLDLKTKEKDGGMEVSLIQIAEERLKFEHKEDRLHIFRNCKEADTINFQITYTGVPLDGLVIAKNKYGTRTFFGDNWPNRAKNWLPCLDHPSDKATCEFIVQVPQQYKVVANGLLQNEKKLDKLTKQYHWKQGVPISTKVMVIGVAPFSVEESGIYKGISVQTWVYPENQKEGFYDYALAVDILKFMEEKFGEYPYEKLANVQSNTRYGGMENASAIFYAESSVTGTRSSEALLAHEIVHQWFGNSATEKDWYHLWLSEGFATYFTHVYMEQKYGRAKLVERMKKDKHRIFGYYQRRNNSAIVDTTIKNLNFLLNANNYQKGGWVLHMLRYVVGENNFWKGIRTYYEKYRDKNVLTEDFQAVMEDASGQKLDWFFGQWIYRSGQPEYEGTWKYDNRNKEIILEMKQTQKSGKLFQMPLEIAIYSGKKQDKIEKIWLRKVEEKFRIKVDRKPDRIILDPNNWVLMQGETQILSEK